MNHAGSGSVAAWWPHLDAWHAGQHILDHSMGCTEHGADAVWYAILVSHSCCGSTAFIHWDPEELSSA